MDNARIVSVLSDRRAVINRGARDGIKEGQRVAIARADSEELIDPASGESLGFLKLPVMEGKISIVNERVSIVEFVGKRSMTPLGLFKGLVDYRAGNCKPWDFPVSAKELLSIIEVLESPPLSARPVVGDIVKLIQESESEI